MNKSVIAILIGVIAVLAGALAAFLIIRKKFAAEDDFDEFEDFVELIIYITLFDDMEAPDSYEISNESIETVDEDDYYSEAFDDDIDSADFLKFFGDTRTADIGRVTDEFGYVDIDCYILEIDGAYYLIGFSYVYGSVGG